MLFLIGTLLTLQPVNGAPPTFDKPIGAVAGNASVGPAHASDFGEMGTPEFARTILLPVQRRQEIACHRLWLNGHRDQALKPLIDEIRRRLAIELGNASAALDAMPAESLADGMAVAVTMETPSGRRGDPYLEAGRCDAIASAFTDGGMDKASPLLAPARDGPIPLPSIGYCLAQLEQGPSANRDPSIGETLAKMWQEMKVSSRISAADRATIEHDYATHDTTPPLPSNPEIKTVDPEPADVLCFQGIATLAKMLGWRN